MSRALIAAVGPLLLLVELRGCEVEDGLRLPQTPSPHFGNDPPRHLHRRDAPNSLSSGAVGIIIVPSP